MLLLGVSAEFEATVGVEVEQSINFCGSAITLCRSYESSKYFETDTPQFSRKFHFQR